MKNNQLCEASVYLDSTDMKGAIDFFAFLPASENKLHLYVVSLGASMWLGHSVSETFKRLIVSE